MKLLVAFYSSISVQFHSAAAPFFLTTRDIIKARAMKTSLIENGTKNSLENGVKTALPIKITGSIPGAMPIIEAARKWGYRMLVAP